MSLSRRLFIVASLTALAAPLSGGMQGRPSPRTFTDDVRVTRVSRDPPAGSGVLLFFVLFTGRTLAGERSYLIPYMEIGQAKPHAGQRCEVDWHWWSGAGSNGVTGDGGSARQGRWVTGFRCDGGRE